MTPKTREFKITLEWIHHYCRNDFYATTKVRRFPVPVDLFAWTPKSMTGHDGRFIKLFNPVEWPEYAPVEYTSPSIHGKPWADPDISDPAFHPKWNEQDGLIDRRSWGRNSSSFSYIITEDGRPRNPIGRTGITGRGLLGRWGPNHAADPIITRWKPTSTPPTIDEELNRPEKSTEDHSELKRDILQFLAIQRRDTHQWAIPGGMVDVGESVDVALQRELTEETMSYLSERPALEKRRGMSEMDKFMKTGDLVYKGYIDDPRNTDNAWIETTAVNFHDHEGTVFRNIPLSAGDDACDVMWMDIDKNIELYAQHKWLLHYVVILRDAYPPGGLLP